MLAPIAPKVAATQNKQPRDRRTFFRWGLAAAIFVVILGVLLYFRPVTMVIAVSRSDVAELKIAQLLIEHNRSKSSSLRLSVLETQTPEEALQLLEKGQVELAIGRSDMKLPESSTSIAVFKKMQPFFALNIQKESPAELSPAWLKGKVIGYANSPLSNRTLLESVLRHWQLLDSVTLVPIAPGQLISVSKKQHLDAHFTINAANVDAAGAGAKVLDSVRMAFSRGFAVLPLSDSAALIGKIPGLEEGKIPRGFFEASPALPAEELVSAAVLSNLMIAKDKSDGAIAATVKALIAMKEAQLSRNPDLANIAEPSKTNRNVAFNSVAGKVHDGTYENIFDKYTNQIYVGLALLGGIASLGTGAFRRQRQTSTAEISDDLQILLAMRDSLVKPLDASEFDQLRLQADAIYRSALENAGRGQIASVQLMAIDLAYKRVLEINRTSEHIDVLASRDN